MMKTDHNKDVAIESIVYLYHMEGLTHYEQEFRPWGNFERFTLNEVTTVKLLTLAPEGALSLQTHEHRDEFGRVIKGSGTIRIKETEKELNAGDTFFIPRNTEHRTISGPDGLTILEIAFGDFNELDEKRLEDEYGRA